MESKFKVGDLVTICEPKRGEEKSYYEVAQIEERLSVEGWYFVYYLKTRGENGFGLPYAYEEGELGPSVLEETKRGELFVCNIYELRLKLNNNEDGENSTVIHRAVTAEELFTFWDKVKDYFSTMLNRSFGEPEMWVPVYVELEMARRNFEGICFYQVRTENKEDLVEEISVALRGDVSLSYQEKLPCAPLTTVWVVKTDGVKKGVISYFQIMADEVLVYISYEGQAKDVYDISWFGEVIFLDESEAKKKL